MKKTNELLTLVLNTFVIIHYLSNPAPLDQSTRLSDLIIVFQPVPPSAIYLEYISGKIHLCCVEFLSLFFIIDPRVSDFIRT